MRICMIATGHDVFDRRVFYLESKSLSKKYKVTVIGQHPKKIHQKIDGIEVISIPKPPNIPIIRFFFRVFYGLKIAIEKNCDVYHCHDADSYLIGLMMKLFKRKKLVYDAHELLAEKSTILYHLIWYPLLVVLEFILVKYADITFTDSEFSKKRLENKYGKKVVSIENFPKIDYYLLNDKKFIKKKELGIDENDIVIGRFGGMAEPLATLETIEIFEKLQEKYKNLKLLLIGKILSENYRKKIEKKLKMCKNVILLPHQPFTEIPRYYGVVDIGIILEKPSEDNKISSSSKTFEYMLYGIPFITVDCIELNKKVVKKYGCGFTVNFNDTNDILEKLEKLIVDSDLRKKMGKKGKEAIIREYNWDIVEKKLLSSYSEFIENKNQKKSLTKSLN